MYELDESKYFYLLFLIPALVILFLYIQFWKIKAQRQFGDKTLVA